VAPALSRSRAEQPICCADFWGVVVAPLIDSAVHPEAWRAEVGGEGEKQVLVEVLVVDPDALPPEKEVEPSETEISTALVGASHGGMIRSVRCMRVCASVGVGSERLSLASKSAVLTPRPRCFVPDWRQAEDQFNEHWEFNVQGGPPNCKLNVRRFKQEGEPGSERGASFLVCFYMGQQRRSPKEGGPRKTVRNLCFARVDMPLGADESELPNPFYDMHAAWYHAYHMAPHLYASSFLTGKRVYLSSPGVQEGCFRSIKQHAHLQFPKSEHGRPLRTVKGIMMLTGNPQLDANEDKLNFFGYSDFNLRKYIALEGKSAVGSTPAPASETALAGSSGKSALLCTSQWGR